MIIDHILSGTEILGPMAGAAGPAAVVELESRGSNILFTQNVLFLPEYYTYRAPIIITGCIKSITTSITYLPYAKV